MINLIINNRKIVAESGKSVLQIAEENGIEIPSLCYDNRLEVYGSCGICTVEVANAESPANFRLLRACSALAADGMVISTDSERVRKSRKFTLELLLSDHTGDCKPPCSLACPAETDCQGYAKLIASGDFPGAVKRIYEKVPFPASIGQICPRPCEEACRRRLVEEPIAIAALKQFVGQLTVDNGQLIVDNCLKAESSGKSVGIAGGGPAGLSAAYYLRLKGHGVTVYEAMPELGGMLRYGVPEFRLPKAVLQKEIALIGNLGVEFKTNTKITLDDIRDKHDAIIAAIGAWNSVKLNIPGEIGGIDFLRALPSVKGKKVGVIGGGNTAMDACRVALRNGAEKVCCIYRRTRDVMPADKNEVLEAEREGVIFMFSTPPDQIPAGLVDVIISAIGQKPVLDGFEALEKTEWGTIVADKFTFRTNFENVFAIGDATNDGADIAISAIGEAGKCAEVVHRFLKDEHSAETVAQKPKKSNVHKKTSYERLEGFSPFSSHFLVKSEKTPDDFAHCEKKPRIQPLTEETARSEAARCLECGCADFYNCKLIKYAGQYDVTPEKFAGKCSGGEQFGIAGKITHNGEKCILCGLCVRVCDQVEGKTVLGLSGRGFNTTVKTAFGKSLEAAGCNSCGKCAEVCPTGAIV